MTALPLTAPRPGLLDRMLTDAPALTRLGLLIGLALIPLLAAQAIDPRMLDGVGIWTKPIKFHLALSIYLLTLAAFARWLPPGLMRRRWYRAYETCVVIAILGELIWIGGAAALGTTSHFNVATPVMAAIYGLMGLFAVSLTSLSLVHGIAIMRNRATGLPPVLRLGIGLGLILTFGLTVVVAGYMSQTDGHLVGTPSDTARTLWLMGWSREVGDLRVAHFLATHAMHAIPLAALLAWLTLPPRAANVATLAAAVGFAALVGLSFRQALLGRPFLPWLG